MPLVFCRKNGLYWQEKEMAGKTSCLQGRLFAKSYLCLSLAKSLSLLLSFVECSHCLPSPTAIQLGNSQMTGAACATVIFENIVGIYLQRNSWGPSGRHSWEAAGRSRKSPGPVVALRLPLPKGPLQPVPPPLWVSVSSSVKRMNTSWDSHGIKSLMAF